MQCRRVGPLGGTTSGGGLEAVVQLHPTGRPFGGTGLAAVTMVAMAAVVTGGNHHMKPPLHQAVLVLHGLALAAVVMAVPATATVVAAVPATAALGTTAAMVWLI